MLYLSSALQTRSIRFGRQASLSWLATYPGDLNVSFYLAKFLLLDGKHQQASTILEDICAKDPEFVDAQDALATANAGTDNKVFENSISCAYALGKNVQDKSLVPAWGMKLRSAIKYFRTNQFQDSKSIIEEILSYNMDIPLPAIYHLYLVARLQDKASLSSLAELYQQRWGDALVINYMVVNGYFKKGDDANAVRLLHRCATYDSQGLIAARIWGKDNPYQTLWPEIRPIVFNVSLPAEISALFGWNKLEAGTISDIDLKGDLSAKSTEPEYFNSKTFDLDAITETDEQPAVEMKEDSSNQEDIQVESEIDNNGVSFASETEVAESTVTKEKVIKSDETLKAAEDAFKRLAQRLNQKNLEKADGRFPMYVILSTKKGLLDTYGPQTTSVIDKEMRSLADAIKEQKGWGSLVFYPDDAENNPRLGLPVAKTIDPWELKLALTDLDKSLSAKGAMIGAVLIVGGNDVLPFHKLPNPTDDADTEVFSDNPYATLDSNYFIPEWPVGRMPGEKGSDASLLLLNIRQAIAFHKPSKKVKSFLEQIKPGLELFRQLMSYFLLKPMSNGKKNFGYSAAVWQKSSQSVFKTIGETQSMLLSPPEYSGSFPCERINYAELGYFNLHGLVDSADWYGQPDSSGGVSGVDYPVAIKPKDIHKNGKAPEFIFTEACYGGHVEKKTEIDSVALRFIAIGTKAIVGSTCISYGSISSPLIGADLLGYLFWKYLKSGLRVGDAFVKAKVDFVREMNKRQDFLDGEDQKTLISFVLYGDPLAVYSSSQMVNKNQGRQKVREDVTTVCDEQEVGEEVYEDTISPEKIRKVKELVENYLPGMNQANIVVSKQILVNDNKVQDGAVSPQTTKQRSTASTGKTVITISKQVKSFNNVHHHYARATLDKSGKMIKLAVSR